MLHICGITITYARTELLQEAIACFLAQTYENKSLIVLNTFPSQTLTGKFPGVTIINCDTRPPSLAHARNLAIAKAPEGSVCVTCDDDDITLPTHFTTVASHFSDDFDWVHLSKMFYMEASRIKGVVPGNFNCLAFRKSAFLKVGQYPNGLTVGEDRALVGKLTESRHGKKIALSDDQASFIYRWAQGSTVLHVSGQGPDRAGHQSASDRVAAYVEHRVRQGLIPTGAVHLTPKLAYDYAGMAETFLRNWRPDKRSRPVIVLLSKTGDICNALPIAHHIFRSRGVKPYWMVHRQYAPLLDGISYVEPYVVDLQIDEAMKLAKEEFGAVIQAQAWGGIADDHQCQSFNQESWRKAGFFSEFNNPSWSLVFDRRDQKREAALLAKVSNEKPLLLINVSSAIASPPIFDHKKILKAVRAAFADHNVLSIADLILERPYDLLGLMDRAKALISIDTMYLHIAAASNVPVVALVNHQGWLGSTPRSNVASRIPYDKVSPETVIDGIRTALAQAPRPPAPSPVASFVDQTEWPCGLYKFPNQSANVEYFNCGIIDWQNHTWLVARKHTISPVTDRIVFWKLLDNEPVAEYPLVLPDASPFEQQEDPRAMILKPIGNEELFLSWANHMPKSTVHQCSGFVSQDFTIPRIHHVRYGRNGSGRQSNTNGHEKNWVWFMHDGWMHFIYETNPMVVCKADVVAVLHTYTNLPKALPWPHGEIRGGTPPIRVGNEYITFFHSSVEFLPPRRRYMMGALAFEAKPPFSITRITPEALLTGSEADPLGSGRGIPLCIFPCGCIFKDSEWLVTFGVNDHSCGWIKIPDKDLQERMAPC